jgi:nucleoside-diphosphate-sugar epimerase
VHGSSTAVGEAFTEISPLHPDNHYAVSKVEAEARLTDFFSTSSCDLSILRPALVYGRGAPGNFRRLVHAIDYGLPFPVSKIDNLRSFVSLANLVSAIECVSLSPRAAGEVYLVSDQELISTPALIRTLALARNKTPRFFSLPTSIRGFFCNVPLLGRRYSQLVNNLVIDSSKLRTDLSWSQPFLQSFSLEKSFRQA